MERISHIIMEAFIGLCMIFTTKNTIVSMVRSIMDNGSNFKANLITLVLIAACIYTFIASLMHLINMIKIYKK